MTKPTITKTRYTVVRDFGYVTAGRTYDFATCSNSRDVDVRRIDGSGIGTYISNNQFRAAIADGWIVPVPA